MPSVTAEVTRVRASKHYIVEQEQTEVKMYYKNRNSIDYRTEAFAFLP